MDKNKCERCGGKIGASTDRGCAWDKQAKKWVYACFDCKRQIAIYGKSLMDFPAFKATCEHLVDVPLQRRPANALCLEIAKPADRCRLMTPEHWKNADPRAVRWIYSGGSPLVLGCCSRKDCPNYA